jgi:methyl-accepting chemotaxis protein
MTMAVKNLSFRTQLLAAFSVLTLVIAGLGLFGLRGIAAVNDRLVEVNTNWLPSVRAAQEMGGWASRHGLDVYRHIATTDDDAIAAVDRRLAELTTKMDAIIEIYRPLVASPEEGALFAKVTDAWASYVRLAEPVLVLSRRNDNVVARDLMEATADKGRQALSARTN